MQHSDTEKMFGWKRQYYSITGDQVISLAIFVKRKSNQFMNFLIYLCYGYDKKMYHSIVMVVHFFIMFSVCDFPKNWIFQLACAVVRCK